MRKHNVSKEEAIKFVKEADISITVWNGKYERFYGKNGTVYVCKEDCLIRTAFKADSYDDRTKLIMEVIRG